MYSKKKGGLGVRSTPQQGISPYTLLGGAPHPPDPPGLKIHEKLNFQKISRPNFFLSPGPLGIIELAPGAPLKMNKD